LDGRPIASTRQAVIDAVVLAIDAGTVGQP
jgi:hypothetical protein